MELKMTLSEVQSLPSIEVEQWRSFFVVKRHLEEWEQQRQRELG